MKFNCKNENMYEITKTRDYNSCLNRTAYNVNQHGVYMCRKGNIYFSFVLNKVLNNVAARKHNTKRNKTRFILYAYDSPPLNSREFWISFLRYVLLCQSKTLIKIYEKIFTVLVLRNQHQNFAQLINKPPPPPLLICNQNFDIDFVKPIL